MARSKNTKYCPVRAEELDNYIEQFEEQGGNAVNLDAEYYLRFCKFLILRLRPKLKSVSLERLLREVRAKGVPAPKTIIERRRQRQRAGKVVPTDPAVLDLRENHRLAARRSGSRKRCSACGGETAEHDCAALKKNKRVA